jgi:hypothetical protein
MASWLRDSPGSAATVVLIHSMVVWSKRSMLRGMAGHDHATGSLFCPGNFVSASQVTPGTRIIKGSYNLATTVAMWAPGTVFMRFDFQPELFVPVVKSEVDDTISFDIE